jgi:IclR family acetate operon transcriptional repressor
MAKRGRKPAATLSRRRQATTRQAPDRTQVLQSLVRATSLLNWLAQCPEGTSLSVAARQTGLPVATAHRILTTLQQERYARFDAERRSWFVGVQAFVTGNAFARHRGLVEMARPRMWALMEEAGETVNLAIEDGGEAVYLVQIEGRQGMRVIARPGSRVPLYCSAAGRALLTAMPEERVRRIFTKRAMARLTPKTLIEFEALHEDLLQCRRRGYAIDNQEHSVGVKCVASVIYNEYAEPFGAISISGPALRISDQRVPLLGTLVREAAFSITAALGGQTTHRFDDLTAIGQAVGSDANRPTLSALAMAS